MEPLTEEELLELGIIRQADVTQANSEAFPELKQAILTPFDPLSDPLPLPFEPELDDEALEQQEQATLERKLLAATIALLAGAIALALWQTTIARELKYSHIRMTELAAGGYEAIKMSPDASRYWRLVGRNLRDEYVKLAAFAIAIAAGDKSDKQIQAWIRWKSKSIFVAFSRASILYSAIAIGFNEARRDLDPSADHCEACPLYSTNGQYVPIEQVVPIGHACPCGGHCHCKIRFRFNRDRLLVRR